MREVSNAHACPIFPGKRYEDWDIADPADQPLEVVRRIRYDIHHHVCDLLDSLNIALIDALGREAGT